MDPFERYPTNTELDAERRLAEGGNPVNVSGPGVARTFQAEGNDTSQFVGVSPEFQSYPGGDDRMRPFAADGGVEAELEQKFSGYMSDAGLAADKVSEDESSEDENVSDEDTEGEKTTSTKKATKAAKSGPPEPPEPKE